MAEDKGFWGKVGDTVFNGPLGGIGKAVSERIWNNSPASHIAEGLNNGENPIEAVATGFNEATNGPIGSLAKGSVARFYRNTALDDAVNVGSYVVGGTIAALTPKDEENPNLNASASEDVHVDSANADNSEVLTATTGINDAVTSGAEELVAASQNLQAATTQQPITAPTFENKVFGYGHHSQDTLQLQQFLNSQGASIAEDQQFGNETRTALAAFQEANGLTGDGIMGPATAAKIQEIAAKSAAPTEITVEPENVTEPTAPLPTGELRITEGEQITFV